MISRELLSEVLAEDIEKVEVGKRYIKYWSGYTPTFKQSINTYELAHKCKIYAINKGFIIETSYEDIIEPFGEYCICRVYFDGDKVYDNYSEYEGYQKEPEAIFKATQYIYDKG